MPLLVLAYPQLEREDYDWIQSFRAKHDERYFNIVQPHFTIVFPVEEINPAQFIKHVEDISRKFKEFFFVLRCAQPVKDFFSDYTDVFLIPEEGYRIFIKLHDSMYNVLLEKELRLDTPFIPHVGIGNSLDPFVSKKLADKINKSENLGIIGAVNKLDVVSYENNSITTLKRIVL